MSAERIAVEIFETEAQFRAGLRKASAQFRAECLAVLEGAARQEAAKYRGARTGLVKGKRVPVSAIARAAALSVFRKYLTERNIPRREVLTPGAADVADHAEPHGDERLPDTAPEIGRNLDGLRHEAHTSDDSVHAGATAASLSREDAGESGGLTEFRSKRTRGAPPGISEGSRTMARDASVGVPMEGQHFIARRCVLARTGGSAIVIPAGPWGRQREIAHRWRLLRGEVYGPISLLDPNLEALHGVAGTQIAAGPLEWQWGLVQTVSLLPE